MNHQLIISNQLKLVLLSSCRLPCGRIIFQSFVIPLFHVFVFPGCISSSWRSRCFCSLLFWWFSLFKRCIISVQSFRRSLAAAAAAPTCWRFLLLLCWRDKTTEVLQVRVAVRRLSSPGRRITPLSCLVTPTGSLDFHLLRSNSLEKLLM